MSIKEIMLLGTDGMTTAQKQEEKERRIKVSERINLLHSKKTACENAARTCEKGSAAAKLLNGKVKQYNREINRIKGEESGWLKSVAWFMYC